MIVSPNRQRWLPFVGATVAFALALAACGDDAPADVTAPPTTAGTTATGDITTGNAATPALAQLQDALDAVGTRYAFTADVTLDGTPVTQVRGTIYDGAGRYVVTAGGSDIEYVVSDDGQWAREPGGEWGLVAGAAPLVDPIAPLTAPRATVVLEADGTDALVEAVYDGASLGFSTGGDVTVTVRITGGVVTSIAYEAPVGDGIATVVTTFDPTADVTPIQVPPA